MENGKVNATARGVEGCSQSRVSEVHLIYSWSLNAVAESEL